MKEKLFKSDQFVVYVENVTAIEYRSHVNLAVIYLISGQSIFVPLTVGMELEKELKKS